MIGEDSVTLNLDLDHPERFRALDSDNLLGWINTLATHLEDAYRMGLTLPMPAVRQYRGIVLTGVGGSIQGADLFSAYAAPLCPLPIVLHRDYDLPHWAGGEDVLVVALSLGGNAEETLASVEAAHQRGCPVLAAGRGGKLMELAEQHGDPFWQINFAGPPRASVGWFFGYLLALFFRLGLIPDPAQELMAAVETMQAQQAKIGAEVPTRQNSAKRLAGQVVARWVSIFGSGMMAAVARRWKAQVNELAKAWAQADALPDADYNAVEGVNHPEELIPRAYAVFLNSGSDHPRNQLRTQLTQQSMLMEGIPTDVITARGATRMEQLWTAVQYGDYFSYYLAMIYGADPNPVERIHSIQDEMADQA